MAGELAGKTILLVDDDRDILAAISAALEELEPRIVTAIDGNEAVAQAQQHNPDLIILDQMLPKRSGFLVLEQLRGIRKPDNERFRVIMITANLGTRHKAYAESLGVDEYFNKPIRMERLIESIKKLLAE